MSCDSSLSSLLHGTLTFSSLELNSTAQYECEDFYEFEDGSNYKEVRCEFDDTTCTAEWTTLDKECQSKL